MLKNLRNLRKVIALATLVQFRLLGAATPSPAQAQTEKSPYPVMAPLDQYLMSDESSEIALARSAAPLSLSDEAEVMVLRRDGYKVAEKGRNGFLCFVMRSWGASTDAPDFWNPKVRSPICFNPAATRSYVPIFLLKTRLVLAGKTKAQIVAETDAAFDTKELPALEPDAMCYMMSKQQYLSDEAKHWHPHLMVLVPGDAAKTWGGNLPGSPIIALNDPEERVTIMLVWVGKWSDGTLAPPIAQ